MLSKHGINFIHITTDKRFRCSSCFTGFDPIDAKADCLECFGTAYKAIIAWMQGVIVKPARNPEVNDLVGYENPRGYRVYVSPLVTVSVGDIVIEIDSHNQPNSKSPIPPIALRHTYFVETVEALYFNSQVSCYQCTCRVDDILVDSYSKLLMQL